MVKHGLRTPLEGAVTGPRSSRGGPLSHVVMAWERGRGEGAEGVDVLPSLFLMWAVQPVLHLTRYFMVRSRTPFSDRSLLPTPNTSLL